MPPKMDVWTGEMDIKLIEAVHRAPILWDIQNPRYSRNDLKEQMWEDIATSSGGGITGVMAKVRFTNMKTTYQQNVRKISQSKKSGAGTDSVYVPKWKLFNLLNFLQKSMQQGESFSNINSGSESSSSSAPASPNIDDVRCFKNNKDLLPVPSIYFDEHLQAWQTIPPDSEQICTGLSLPTCSSPATDVSLPDVSPPPRAASAPVPPVTTAERTVGSHCFIPPTPPTALFSRRGEKKKRTSTDASAEKSEVLQAAVEAINTISKQEASTPQDSLEAFGEYVVARLREMDAKERKRAKLAILEALEESE